MHFELLKLPLQSSQNTNYVTSILSLLDITRNSACDLFYLITLYLYTQYQLSILNVYKGYTQFFKLGSFNIVILQLLQIFYHKIHVMWFTILILFTLQVLSQKVGIMTHRTLFIVIVKTPTVVTQLLYSQYHSITIKVYTPQHSIVTYNR